MRNFIFDPEQTFKACNDSYLIKINQVLEDETILNCEIFKTRPLDFWLMAQARWARFDNSFENQSERLSINTKLSLPVRIPFIKEAGLLMKKLILQILSFNIEKHLDNF